MKKFVVFGPVSKLIRPLATLKFTYSRKSQRRFKALNIRPVDKA